MNRNESFVRKVIYISAIALLLIPLSWLGQPGINTEKVQSPGGTLAQLRTEYHLSQTQLGDIDPAGESMKLATLGLRGVAANILWEKAIDFKMKHDWDNLRATLTQITKLQPNFIKVWEYQAHNLSYNVSAEFDDYRHRYRWVKKGIDFLIVGTRYNRMEPKLFHFTGWIVGQKIGRSDEHALFRVLFRDDDEFHTHLNNYIDIEDAKDFYGQYDNWLAARLWFLKAYDLVDNKGAPLRGKNSAIFFKDGAMSRINYAMAHEEEFDPGEGEIPQRAWETAGEEWREYGNRELPTTWGPFISLNGKQAAADRIARLRQQLDELAPEARERIRQEKIAEMPERQRATIDKSLVSVSDFDVADRVASASRRKAREIAREIGETRERLGHIEDARHNVSYDFWETRCAAESEDLTTRARKFLFDAHRLHKDVKLDESRYLDEDGKSIELSAHLKPAFATLAAVTVAMPCTIHLVNYREFVRDEENPIYVMQDGAEQKFDKGFDLWAEVFKKYPLLADRTFAEELAPSFRAYRQVLQNLGHEELPSDFVLMALLDFETGFYDLPKSRNLRRRAAQEAKAKDETPKTKTQSDNGKSGSDPTSSKQDSAAPDKSKKDDAMKPGISKPGKDKPSTSAPKTGKTNSKKTDLPKEEPEKSSTGGASTSVQPQRPDSPQTGRARILRRRR